MITYKEAISSVQLELEKLQHQNNLSQLKIVSHKELDFGWLFYYNTKEYLENGDLSMQLAGNGPIVVDKKTGELQHTGTAYPIEFYIKMFKESQGY